MSNEYIPPKVWTHDSESGGQWASINRPDSGARHEQALPVGEHALQLYSLATPNGQKVTIMLEELLALGKSDAEYDAYLINIGEGDQFGSGFVDVNPNSKIPALLDRSGDTPVRVFESGNILLYLAEKFGALLPSDPAKRVEAMNWLFWLQALPLILEAVSATSTLTHQKSSNTQLTVSLWKQNASYIYWTLDSLRINTLVATNTALLISQLGLGMAI